MTEGKPAEPKPKPDLELEALHACVSSLAKLTSDQCRRVLEYLQQRFQQE